MTHFFFYINSSLSKVRDFILINIAHRFTWKIQQIKSGDVMKRTLVSIMDRFNLDVERQSIELVSFC